MNRNATTSRIAQILHDGGPTALFWKVLGELCYRRIHLFVDDLEAPLDAPGARIPLDYGLLEPSRIDDYLSLAPKAARAEISRRLAAGHECVTATQSGRLVGYCWSGARRAPVDYLGVDIALKPGWFYGYELHVDPSMRRQRVSVGILVARRRILRELGHRFEVTAVMPENKPAYGFQRIMRRKPAGSLGVLWLGSWRHPVVRLNQVEPFPRFTVIR